MRDKTQARRQNVFILSFSVYKSTAEIYDIVRPYDFDDKH